MRLGCPSLVQKFIVDSVREVPVVAVWCGVFALAGRAGSATGVRLVFRTPAWRVATPRALVLGLAFGGARMAGGGASGTGLRFSV